jgi:SAM-dependent methyltransferase
MNSAKDKNWQNESVKKFYLENRSSPSQLYSSEKYFFDKIDLRNKSILDIGCACGGFYNIFKVLYENINYTGVDISPELIFEAGRLYPEASFCVSAGEKLGFENESFDLVFSTGVFHLIEDGWRDLYREAYRTAREKVLIDFRITDKESRRGRIKLDFYGAGEKNYALYTVLNIFELFDFLNALKPKPFKISAYGYNHKPSAMADINIDDICMAFFLVEKGGLNNKKTGYSIGLPFDNIEKKINERYL